MPEICGKHPARSTRTKETCQSSGRKLTSRLPPLFRSVIGFDLMHAFPARVCAGVMERLGREMGMTWENDRLFRGGIGMTKTSACRGLACPAGAGVRGV